jgi:iron complex transport system substrate-binding protein
LNHFLDRRPRRIPLVAAAALCLTALLAGCGASAPAEPSAKPAAATAAGPRTAYPVQAENCGRTVRVERAPQRIVSFFPSHTELLLRLGLKDRIAGRIRTDQSPPKPAYAAAARQVKVLAPGDIGREALLAARPDFILADGEYPFDGKKLPTIAELEKLGVPVYVDSAFCPATTGTATLDAVTADLTALGTLLDAQGAARDAAADLERTLSAVDKAVDARPATPVAMVQIVDKQLYALSGGLYSDILRRAGGKDVLTGTVPDGSNFTPLSAEALAKLDPDVLAFNYTGDADKAASQEWLRTHLSATAAVRGNRLVALPAADFSELRAVDGVATLAKALHPDGP